MGASSAVPQRVAPVDWLICFAVKEEARGARALTGTNRAMVVTGMGRRNAARAIQQAFTRFRPRGVITAGFAGGLNAALPRGTIVFDADPQLGIGCLLAGLGAVPATFHCSSRVAVTAAEKAHLRRTSGADVVEMESTVIRDYCRAAGVPAATIRVISDAADEDLPLDFNALMKPDDRIDWWRFARTLVLRPTLLGRLVTFQRNTGDAAARLGRVLAQVVSREGGAVQGEP